MARSSFPTLPSLSRAVLRLVATPLPSLGRYFFIFICIGVSSVSVGTSPRAQNTMYRSEANGQKRFKVALSSSVKEVEGRLSLRRNEMDAAWADLDQRWSSLEERIGSIGIVRNPERKSSSDEHMLELNVGGSLVNFRRPAEAGRGDLRTLANLLEFVWDERLPRGELWYGTGTYLYNWRRR